jgi:tetratricopeptide (TPR) repeat protein
MTESLDRLKDALADRYSVERELGSGGMATVYLAEDLKHRRKVAVKVLKPELSAALGPERFLREIEILAGLDHPHILPLYDSGEAEGYLYYVMPYVEGESLRDRLDREKQLPIDDAAQIALEVADALSHAHSHGVIHRDIKPENVMLAGGHARVADFGIARAITAAGGGRLTETGMAIGTPAYMSPEQASADSDLDGRSDLYSLGCVLYEMLAGEPPFTGPTVESVVRQHLTSEPPPITTLRPAVPAEIATTLMRVLAKTPADRFSPAAQFAEALRRSSGVTAPQATAAPATSAVWSQPIRAAASFALLSVAALAVIYGLVVLLGLPGWVFVVSAGLLLVGLPMVVATSALERARASGSAKATGAVSLFTWRRTVYAGLIGFGGLGVATFGYTGMRVLGIGPAGTLIATGAIAERERLILADFENRTSDSTHGATVTELLRIGLSQSQAVSVLDPMHVSRILQLMERDPSQGVPERVAYEAAEREGIKAVITGEIASVGSGYSISARLVSVDGQVLTAQQVSARDDDEIVGAVDQLSVSLRERFGESLRSIRRTEPLEQVTTSSQRALRLFSQGLRAWNQGDVTRAMQLLEEVIGLDSTFAMAHRKLAIILNNQGERRSLAVREATLAYQYRDRLTERERYLVTAAYHSVVTGDRDQQISAYRTVLDLYPDETIALNNLGVIYSNLRDYDRAAEYYDRALEVDPTTRLHYSNLAGTLGTQGRFDSAEVVIDLFAERFTDNPEVAISRIMHVTKQKDFEVAEEMGLAVLAAQRGEVFWEATAYEWMANLDAMRGRMESAERRWQRSFDLTMGRRLQGRYLMRAARQAIVERLLRDDPGRARTILDDAMRRIPLESLDPLDRPYVQLALAYAAAEEAETARLLIAEYEATSEADHSMGTELWKHGALGVAALVEGDLDTAIPALWQFDEGNSCNTCAHPWLARAYDRAGQADSARILYERFVQMPSSSVSYDAAHLAHGYMRLGQLYEGGGEPDRALEYYGRFVELWEQADPEFQQVVDEVKRAIARLSSEPRGD